MKKNIKYFIVILISTLVNIYGQEVETYPDKTTLQIKQTVESFMMAKYGKEFPLARFFILDKMINKDPSSYRKPYFYEEMKDPYGKLSGFCLFACVGQVQYSKENTWNSFVDSSIVGLIKDGVIIWDSGPLILGEVNYELDFCDDINSDGVVDIGISAYHTDMRDPENSKNYLWIFSWDGVNGRFINDYDFNTRKSNLESGPFDLIDWDGDGIFEIVACYNLDADPPSILPQNYPIVTYGWNGIKYGLWSSVYQLKWNDYYPARWLTAAVKAKVKKMQNNLRFDYALTNNPGSKQKIAEMIIDNINLPKVDTTLTKASKDIDSYGCLLLGNAWDFEACSYWGYVKPGETKSDYYYIGEGLPGICEVYVLGKSPINGDIDSTMVFTLEMEKENIYKNSFKTFSIGLKAIPQVLDTLGFIDTIKTYNEKSIGLGWIKTQQTKDKYAVYLSEAKTALQQNNILAARTNLQNILRDVDVDSVNAITSEAYALLKYNTEYLLSKLPVPPAGNIAKLVNSSNTKLSGGSLQYYEGAWKDAVNNNDGTFTIPTTLKTVSLRMNYAFGSQTKNNVAIGRDTIVFQTKNVQVKLLDSKGAILDTGKVQYYAGAWRDFGATTNGVVANELLPLSYSFRMNYAFASLDKTQNVGTDPTVVFQTVSATVELKNSSGNFIDAGTVQYYSGAWRDFGATTNGVVAKELLPLSYSFRMNYAFASLDKTQNIGTDPTVVFQTVPSAVQLKNSSGNFIDAGIVQYYSGAWRDFGATTNGVVTKELLPLSYAFRMNYAFASLDKTQNVSTDPTVVFQTVPATVQLKNSSGNFIDVGTVQYYSGAWRDFGVTANGIVSKELLPLSYAFRMNYAFASLDKTQNVGTNPTVVFQTVPATVQLKNSSGSFIDAGTVQYYSGAWRDFGATTNGVVTKELLPLSYAFRMTHEYVSLDKTQNVGTNNIVLFSTVLARISVTDNLNLPVNNALVSYYSGAWRQIGTTTNGVITKELLPISLSFRAALGTKQADKTQNLGAGNNVEIKLP